MSHTMHLQIQPVGSLSQYIETVRRFPVLSCEEEMELARRFHEQQDLDAARQLVMSHLRYVVYIARGFSGYGLPQADLIQEGNIGLMKAVKRFRPEHKVRLITFAVHWIKAEIQEFVLKNWRIVKVATTKAQRKLFFNLRKNRTHSGWMDSRETQALADKLGVDEETVSLMEQRLAARDIAFDGPVDDEDKRQTVYYAPSNHLAEEAANPLYQLEQMDSSIDSGKRLAQALENLDSRSREIVQARWLSDKKETLQALAKRYRISAERVRQLEKQAFKKIRLQMEEPA
ncbi:MAG: RNA polymerase sigma factor RpoH [Gammaproteobacteria bacterium]|nr:MAG: RNA polymerase sigma factor RpoH [Gammaproteobacteria bacterium]